MGNAHSRNDLPGTIAGRNQGWRESIDWDLEVSGAFFTCPSDDWAE